MMLCKLFYQIICDKNILFTNRLDERFSELDDLESGSARAGTELAIWRVVLPSSGSLPRRMIRAATQTVTRLRPQTEPLPKVLAEFTTELPAGEPMQGRWTRVRITQIARDEYLCEKIRGPLPLESRSATVGNLESAKAFFGGGWVVKELFAALDPLRFPRWP